MVNLKDFTLFGMGEDIAFSIGGILVGFRILQFTVCRSEVSSIVRELNQLNKELRRSSAGRELSNFVHFWQLVIFGTVTFVGAGIAFPQWMFALYTGAPYYQYVFPVDTLDYSMGFWVTTTFQAFTLFTSTITSCLQECIFNDMFTELTVLCRILNKRMAMLRVVGEGERIDEEEELKKLLAIIGEVQTIER